MDGFFAQLMMDLSQDSIGDLLQNGASFKSMYYMSDYIFQ